MINGWFPKINKFNQILSGDTEIWLTDEANVSQKISPIGGKPFWLNNNIICFNRNDGTTQIGKVIINQAYNDYYSSDELYWTGFVATKDGHVDFYEGTEIRNQANGLYLAKYGSNILSYVAPYQDEFKVLVVNNVPVYQGRVINQVLSPAGIIIWQIAENRQISNQSIAISVRNDEHLIFAFEYLGQTYVVTQIDSGTLIYPIGSHYGWYRPGDLYYPDGRVFGNQLRLVGSTHDGKPLFDNYINLNSARIDLRKI